MAHMPLVEVDAHGETRKEEEEENGDKDECGRRIFIVIIIVPPFLSNAAIIGLVVPISAVPAFPEAPAAANTDCPPARPVVSVPFATLIRICDPTNVTLTYVLALGFPEALRSPLIGVGNAINRDEIILIPISLSLACDQFESLFTVVFRQGETPTLRAVLPLIDEDDLLSLQFFGIPAVGLNILVTGALVVLDRLKDLFHIVIHLGADFQEAVRVSDELCGIAHVVGVAIELQTTVIITVNGIIHTFDDFDALLKLMIPAFFSHVPILVGIVPVLLVKLILVTHFVVAPNFAMSNACL
mmetsp:Transcript_13406/g.24659  ORF Transcript_13406/g.24659 Transcript_13406/m.24659 type:complete len:299 (+) Transcript_13406:438-1334(+)